MAKTPAFLLLLEFCPLANNKMNELPPPTGVECGSASLLFTILEIKKPKTEHTIILK